MDNYHVNLKFTNDILTPSLKIIWNFFVNFFKNNKWLTDANSEVSSEESEEVVKFQKAILHSKRGVKSTIVKKVKEMKVFLTSYNTHVQSVFLLLAEKIFFLGVFLSSVVFDQVQKYFTNFTSFTNPHWNAQFLVKKRFSILH